MRVIVCGSRELSDPVRVRLVVRMLQGIAAALPDGESVTVVHGAARGADRLIAAEAQAAGLGVEPFPAAWDQHDREGRTAVPCRCGPDKSSCSAAGVRRNQRMLDSGADLVVAVPAGPLAESRGTRDMASRAARAGVPSVALEGVAV